MDDRQMGADRVDLAYLAFEREVLRLADCSAVSEVAKTKARRRSYLTVAILLPPALLQLPRHHWGWR